MVWEWFLYFMVLWGRCQYSNTRRVSVRIKQHLFCVSAHYNVWCIVGIKNCHSSLGFLRSSFSLLFHTSTLPTAIFLGVWKGEKRPRQKYWLHWSWKRRISSSQGLRDKQLTLTRSLRGASGEWSPICAHDPRDGLKVQSGFHLGQAPCQSINSPSL